MESKHLLPVETHVGAVELRSRNASRLAAFYVHALGMQVLSGRDGVTALGLEGQPFVVICDDSTAVELQMPAPGLFHVAICLPTRADLGLFLQDFTKNGHKLEGSACHIVSDALYFADPDGNGIEFYWDYPKSNWMTTPDGQIEMLSDPISTGAILREADESGRQWNGLPDGSTVGHMHLGVSNVERSTPFYRDILGFDITFSRIPGACFFSAGGYHHHVAINSWRTAGTQPAPDNAVGMTSWTLIVPTQPDVDNVAARLDAANCLKTEDGAVCGIDPDRITVRVQSEA